ncbi:MAG: S24 family peptidase [Candidatus Gastranaerophilales bacterium]|nr:S24 family peptidase [Elusimicrobiota bacterium]MBR6298032.1 S24 family peptidase [Candidatus Gastranaerophilales bacterium]
MRFSKVYSILQNLTYGNISQAELGRVLGVSRSNINYKKDNDVDLSDDDIKKIEEAYNVNILQDDNCIAIPVRGEVEASMGYGVTVTNEAQTASYRISRELARDLNIQPMSSEIIFARGNSMEPTIIGGDSLLIDRSKVEVYDGKIYCVRIDGQLYAKRLQRIAKDKIKVISDNKDYEPIIIDFSKNENYDFEVIGEVRWSGRVFK